MMLRQTILKCARACLIAPVLLPAARADVLDLPVPAATIYPNDIITNLSLTERRFHATPKSVAGFATARSELIGKQARRTLQAGRPVPLTALGVARAVKRGSAVSALYGDDGLSITVLLTALQDGAEGDAIDARNPETGAIVRTRVKGDGTLMVLE